MGAEWRIGHKGNIYAGPVAKYTHRIMYFLAATDNKSTRTNCGYSTNTSWNLVVNEGKWCPALWVKRIFTYYYKMLIIIIISLELANCCFVIWLTNCYMFGYTLVDLLSLINSEGVLWISYYITVPLHYSDVIMKTMSPQITGVSTDCSTVCSGEDQRMHQCSASVAFCGEFTGDRWSPAQRASNADNVSIWWRHLENAMNHRRHILHRP